MASPKCSVSSPSPLTLIFNCSTGFQLKNNTETDIYASTIYSVTTLSNKNSAKQNHTDHQPAEHTHVVARRVNKLLSLNECLLFAMQARTFFH